ncbi:hypothetical protein [Ruegeria pomeroyi]
MQKERDQPFSVANSRRATGKPGFHIKDPYPNTHIVIALVLARFGL